MYAVKLTFEGTVWLLHVIVSLIKTQPLRLF